MDATQLQQKINELESWLIHNPTNPNRAVIEQDLRKLKEQRTQTY